MHFLEVVINLRVP